MKEENRLYLIGLKLNEEERVFKIFDSNKFKDFIYF